MSYRGLLENESLLGHYVDAEIAAATTAALGTTFCWKIAGLRPAIFSGTPGN